MLPPLAHVHNAAESIPAKMLHSSLNKIKHPVNVVKWAPEGRRLLTGSSSGEFTLWNGMGFNFETIMQAHDSAVRAASWSHSDDWLVSADQDGKIKYWQPNFNFVKEMQGHESAIRDIAFSPNDTKFLTASDDSTIKIWDFSGGVEESALTGHGWDVKTADWHSTKGLIVSGSKDHQVKLWDPRTSRCLTTLHGHKSLVTQTRFDPIRGQLLATSARDQTIRVFDLRMMRDVLLLRGHEKDIMTICWHPIHASLLSSGGYDGSLFHYLLDECNPVEGAAYTLSAYDSPDPANASAQIVYPAHRIQHAHDMAIWSMDWHPLGHILASGSNDRVTRFWTRPRPGDTDYATDRWHVGEAAAEAQGSRRSRRPYGHEEEEQEIEDEADGLVDQKLPAKQTMLPGLPGLPGIPTASRDDGSSVGGAQPQASGLPPGFPPIPPPNGAYPLPIPGQVPDLAKLAEMFGGQLPPLPLPAGGANGQQHYHLPPPPLPGFPGFPPVQPGQLPAGFPPPPPFAGGSGVPLGFPPQGPQDGNDDGGVRRRAPLPSQQDSMREEMRRGNYRHAR